jgi:hypothetical protein
LGGAPQPAAIMGNMANLAELIEEKLPSESVSEFNELWKKYLKKKKKYESLRKRVSSLSEEEFARFVITTTEVDRDDWVLYEILVGRIELALKIQYYMNSITLKRYKFYDAFTAPGKFSLIQKEYLDKIEESKKYMGSPPEDFERTMLGEIQFRALQFDDAYNTSVRFGIQGESCFPFQVTEINKFRKKPNKSNNLIFAIDALMQFEQYEVVEELLAIFESYAELPRPRSRQDINYEQAVPILRFFRSLIEQARAKNEEYLRKALTQSVIAALENYILAKKLSSVWSETCAIIPIRVIEALVLSSCRMEFADFLAPSISLLYQHGRYRATAVAIDSELFLPDPCELGVLELEQVCSIYAESVS